MGGDPAGLEAIGDPQVQILAHLVRQGVGLLKPVPDPSSPVAYSYPLNIETEGTGVELLEQLADQGLLDREFHDRVHLCPFCGHFAINFRETCPLCGAGDVSVTPMIHHFRCGYVAPEKDFREGVKYVCRKCGNALRHVGVDYERPASNYLCGGCRGVFPDPRIACFSVKCGKVFGQEQLMMRAIFSYRVTAQGALAASRGTVITPIPREAFLHPELPLYTRRFFRERLEQETKLAQRSGRPLAVLLVSVDRFDEWEKKLGKVGVAALFRDVIMALKEGLRDSDLSALHGDGRVLVYLPDTPEAGARVVAGRFCDRVRAMHPEGGLAVSVGIVIGGPDAARMIERAERAVDEAQASGGGVRVAEEPR
jgi:diguanylate cyclase (GGDEF)-like protein